MPACLPRVDMLDAFVQVRAAAGWIEAFSLPACDLGAATTLAPLVRLQRHLL
jgi:hypothetical protein